jgi:hypothetical protein
MVWWYYAIDGEGAETEAWETGRKGWETGREDGDRGAMMESWEAERED